MGHLLRMAILSEFTLLSHSYDESHIDDLCKTISEKLCPSYLHIYKTLLKVVEYFSEAIGRDSSTCVTFHAKVESFPRDYESQKFPRWITRR